MATKRLFVFRGIMARTFGQATTEVFNLTSGCFTAAGASSGSANSSGYSQLFGFITTDQTTETGSGLLIRQSVDGGTNWDLVSASDVIAASAACAVNIQGNAVRVDISLGATEASALRCGFWLRPI